MIQFPKMLLCLFDPLVHSHLPRRAGVKKHLWFDHSLFWKQVLREKRIPPWMEVVLIPMTGKPSLYPGLFLFTNPCRLVRPVQNVELGHEELVGTMEQVRLQDGLSCLCQPARWLSLSTWFRDSSVFGRSRDSPLPWLGAVCPCPLRCQRSQGYLPAPDSCITTLHPLTALEVADWALRSMDTPAPVRVTLWPG